jgi:hypothetical protein
MVQVGNVPEINDVKQHLDQLKTKGFIREWELPYENILTRLTAAIFFLSPSEGVLEDKIWGELGQRPKFIFRRNEEKKLSQLDWRVEFNKGFEL